jgi:hypothetical protein
MAMLFADSTSKVADAKLTSQSDSLRQERIVSQTFARILTSIVAGTGLDKTSARLHKFV